MVTIKKLIQVKFYQEPSGKEPVREWLIDLKKEDRLIIGSDIKTVQLRWPLGYPLIKSLDVGLWEIRSNLDNRISRLIFTFKFGYIILLHAFIKKTQKTPINEMEIAKKRLRCLDEENYGK